MNGRTERPFNCCDSDADAAYHQVWNFNVAELTPLVAKPFSPGNVSAVAELEHTMVDQVVIGCCTNGRINDLRRAAKILNGRKISKKVRTIVIPATQAIYKQSLKEGLLDIFIDSGAAVSTPSCGPCAGLHAGVLADGEVCLSTTNRNFRGRMGSAGSKVYLANPYIAAATAIAGYICEPKEVVG
jgi:3-isopropylmalate/(R)-2-methylmalate dehydratase large subunit